jgi:predicted RNA binding protein YcfA (HicA-like mRNA interferase family)
MGRLAGFSYSKVVRKSKKAGFQFDRQAKGSHEIWWNPETRKRTTLPNHTGTLPEGTMKAIIKQADITTDTFLTL